MVRVGSHDLSLIEGCEGYLAALEAARGERRAEGVWVPRGRHAPGRHVGRNHRAGCKSGRRLGRGSGSDSTDGIQSAEGWAMGEEARRGSDWGAPKVPRWRGTVSMPVMRRRPEGCNGRAQRLPCQDRRGTTTHILR